MQDTGKLRNTILYIQLCMTSFFYRSFYRFISIDRFSSSSSDQRRFPTPCDSVPILGHETLVTRSFCWDCRLSYRPFFLSALALPAEDSNDSFVYYYSFVCIERGH
uniref:Uncharacterized protein n=1 Tax=Cacopsylla melanoneura TaxID=428564 RepID=A0A8D8QT17_9HEMI